MLQAGLPNSTISKMFKHYPPYRSWDVDTKLHRSLKLWLQELGPEGLAAHLLRFPRTLTRTPREMRDLRLWLLSLGLDADKALRKYPWLMKYRLQSLQGKMDAFHAYNLPGLVSFVLCHPQALERRPDTVFELYSTLAELLNVDPASADVADLGTSQRMLYLILAAELKSRMSFFRQSFAAKHATVRQALKFCVFLLEPGTMKEQAQFLEKMLDLSNAELNKLLKRPQLLNYTSDNLQAHLESFHGLGFSQAHVKAMCLTQPNLLLWNMTSTANVEKWSFLTAILKMSISELAARPTVLCSSLANKFGPRHAFIVQLLTSGSIREQEYRAVQPLIYGSQSDAVFATILAKRLKKTKPIEYTSTFKQQWQVCWEFLRHQHDITIEDIAAHTTVLIAPVEDVLKPCLAVLRSLAARQADFCLADHLTAVATLSNDKFYAIYDLPVS